MKQPVVYILASEPYGTLYIGVTSNLATRIEAHRNGCVDAFTKEHGIHTLVYFEGDSRVESRLEDQADRGDESGVEGPLFGGFLNFAKRGPRLRGDDPVGSDFSIELELVLVVLLERRVLRFLAQEAVADRERLDLGTHEAAERVFR